MPIHDWTRVGANDWHDFHLSWISHIKEAFNGGILPEPFYAQAEQHFGAGNADVLALAADNPSDEGVGFDGGGGGVAVALARPRTRIVDLSDADRYALRRRQVAIRHASGRRLVAVIELASPGNKTGQDAVRQFVAKAAETIRRGVHLMVVDLFPPTGPAPGGLHGAVWGEFGRFYTAPAGEPLTLASYDAAETPVAYVEPTAVGRELFPMPLFLTPTFHIDTPLEATYTAALRGVPGVVRRQLGA